MSSYATPRRASRALAVPYSHSPTTTAHALQVRGDSPRTPSKWESPQTKQALNLRPRMQLLEESAVSVITTAFVFTLSSCATLLLCFISQLRLPVMVPVALMVPATMTLVFYVYMNKLLSETKARMLMQVTETEAELLGISGDENIVVRKAEKVVGSPNTPSAYIDIWKSTTPVQKARHDPYDDERDAIRRYFTPSKSAADKEARALRPSPIGKFCASFDDSPTAQVDGPTAGDLDGKERSTRTSPFERRGTKGFPSAGSVEALRRWIATHILTPFSVREKRWNDEIAVANSMPQITTAQAAALHAEKFNLERYVALSAYQGSADYCRSRLFDLGQDSSMSLYRWDAGGEYKQRLFEAYNSDLPTDAELVLAAFGAFFDERLTLCTSPKGAFSSRYLELQHVGTDSIEPWRRKAGIVLFRSRMRPPHYSVLLPGGKVQDLMPGRNNVFGAILLLVWLLKTEQDGYAGQLYLGDSSIDLLSVLE